MNAVVDGVRVVREGWAPRAWLARFRLLPVAPSRYVDERSLYAVRDMIREHLVSPFPFHIKLSLRIQRVNRQSGELEEDDFMQHLVPWISQPSADPELRMHPSFPRPGGSLKPPLSGARFLEATGSWTASAGSTYWWLLAWRTFLLQGLAEAAAWNCHRP